ncbi:hypothetical protein V1478_008963, partial [Vespula squamosa]
RSEVFAFKTIPNLLFWEFISVIKDDSECSKGKGDEYLDDFVSSKSLVLGNPWLVRCSLSLLLANFVRVSSSTKVKNRALRKNKLKVLRYDISSLAIGYSVHVERNSSINQIRPVQYDSRVGRPFQPNPWQQLLKKSKETKGDTTLLDSSCLFLSYHVHEKSNNSLL